MKKKSRKASKGFKWTDWVKPVNQENTPTLNIALNSNMEVIKEWIEYPDGTKELIERNATRSTKHS